MRQINNNLCSVIIPNYNHAKYLTKRIDSVLNQTYQNFEIIILDDKSSDESQEIIKNYKHPKIKQIVFNEINSGSPFKQWMKGINLSKGKYIWIAESDDYADPNLLKSCMSELSNDDNVAFAFVDSYYVDEEGNIIKNGKNNHLKNKVYSSTMFSKNMIFKNIVKNASAVVFKRDLIPIDQSFTEYKFCGDWLFWSSIGSKGNVVWIIDKLNFFRQHDNKVTTRAAKQGLQFSEGLKVHLIISTLYKIPKFYLYSSIGYYYFSIKNFKNYANVDLKCQILKSWKVVYPYQIVYLLCFYIFRIWKKYLSIILIDRPQRN